MIFKEPFLRLWNFIAVPPDRGNSEYEISWRLYERKNVDRGMGLRNRTYGVEKKLVTSVTHVF